ncbi:MAG TPA: substrate-binding domain-containing protein [Methylococcus sp.]|nr:substrate-binding domain-containing protein [Methylococcus sp.]
MVFKKFWMVPVLAVLGITTFQARAEFGRPYLLIAGSSTIYPLADAVAERISASGKIRRPKVESTGTGGGIKLFCEGVGRAYPDIVLASRPMKKAEFEECEIDGVREITEVKIGYDGIVLVQSSRNKPWNLTDRHLYLALAKIIPDPKCDFCDRLVPNPYKKWNEIDPSLPDAEIQVLGPPPSSGTRDTFAEDVLEAGCARFPTMTKVKSRDAARFTKLCQAIREDGIYESEPEGTILDRVAGGDGIGIVDFGAFSKHGSGLSAVAINGVKPSYETVKSREYPVGRPLFLYVKKAHLGHVPGMEAYLNEFTSDRASGDTGYLIAEGLIPLPTEERRAELDKLKGVVASTEEVPKKAGKKGGKKAKTEGKAAAKAKSAKGSKESKRSS